MAPAPGANSQVTVGAPSLARAVAAIFAAAGVAPADAIIVAEDLVAADLEGVASHGAMLVPMYLDRLLSGSISKQSAGAVVWNRDGAIVLDAANAFGQLTARQAVALAVARAREVGLAA